MLELIFSRPVSGNLPWRDIEALFVELGAVVSERAGSRVARRAVRGGQGLSQASSISRHRQGSCSFNPQMV